MELHDFNLILAFLITISPAVWLWCITRNDPKVFPTAVVSAWVLNVGLIFFILLG